MMSKWEIEQNKCGQWLHEEHVESTATAVNGKIRCCSTSIVQLSLCTVFNTTATYHVCIACKGMVSVVQRVMQVGVGMVIVKAN